MWFTEGNVSKIGNITVSGGITEYPLSPNSGPGAITVGSDHRLWFTEETSNKIGAMTTAGSITEYPIPTSGSEPVGIVGGSDGNLWFTEQNGNQIGRITTAGSITEFPIPTPNSSPQQIALGPDGNLWFTEFIGNNIGKLVISNSMPCAPPSSNASNFNGTPIQGSNVIWFNSNFTASGIPSSGATINFSGGTVSFTADQPYVVQVPNAQITFDPNAVCASTTFSSGTNTWTTVVPLAGSDEIFLSGVAFPVPASFAEVGGRVQGPVTWEGDFSADRAGITIGWKWGAAVYTAFATDYTDIGVKPTHTRTCLYNNSDHAGTPEGTNSNTGLPFKHYVVGGARGGGGSNWTGSWSGTVGVSVCKMSSGGPQ